MRRFFILFAVLVLVFSAPLAGTAFAQTGSNPPACSQANYGARWTSSAGLTYVCTGDSTTMPFGWYRIDSKGIMYPYQMYQHQVASVVVPSPTALPASSVSSGSVPAANVSGKPCLKTESNGLARTSAGQVFACLQMAGQSGPTWQLVGGFTNVYSTPSPSKSGVAIPSDMTSITIPNWDGRVYRVEQVEKSTYYILAPSLSLSQIASLSPRYTLVWETSKIGGTGIVLAIVRVAGPVGVAASFGYLVWYQNSLPISQSLADAQKLAIPAPLAPVAATGLYASVRALAGTVAGTAVTWDQYLESEHQESEQINKAIIAMSSGYFLSSGSKNNGGEPCFVETRVSLKAINQGIIYPMILMDCQGKVYAAVAGIKVSTVFFAGASSWTVNGSSYYYEAAKVVWRTSYVSSSVKTLTTPPETTWLDYQSAATQLFNERWSPYITVVAVPVPFTERSWYPGTKKWNGGKWQ